MKCFVRSMCIINRSRCRSITCSSGDGGLVDGSSSTCPRPVTAETLKQFILDSSQRWGIIYLYT